MPRACLRCRVLSLARLFPSRSGHGTRIAAWLVKPTSVKSRWPQQQVQARSSGSQRPERFRLGSHRWSLFLSPRPSLWRFSASAACCCSAVGNNCSCLLSQAARKGGLFCALVTEFHGQLWSRAAPVFARSHPAFCCSVAVNRCNRFPSQAALLGRLFFGSGVHHNLSGHGHGCGPRTEWSTARPKMPSVKLTCLALARHSVNRQMVGRSRCDVPTRTSAGGTVASTIRRAWWAQDCAADTRRGRRSVPSIAPGMSGILA